MISVLMTARNAGGTLRFALRSTLFALPKDAELLLLLDQCSDNSSQVASSISDPRLKVVESDTRLGINKSRNQLLGMARGDYVAILDADDACLPWRFSASLARIGDHDGLFGTAWVFGSTLRPLPLLPQYPIALDSLGLRLALVERNPLVHGTAFIRRKVLIEAGGYSDSKSEDYELWLRLLNAGYSLKRIGLPLILYRFHPTQASQEPGFMQEVLSHPQLQNQLRILRDQVATDLGVGAAWSDAASAMVRSKLNELAPVYRLERAGLPEPLKRWKNKSH